MKLRLRSLGMYAVVVLVAAAALGACATTGMDRSTEASASIKEVHDEISELYVQADLTALSLMAVLSSEGPEVRKNYDIFALDVPAFEKHAHLVVQREAAMVSAHREYFEEWRKQGSKYVNPAIRKLSEDRRAMLATLYDEVLAGNQSIAEYYRDNLTDLQEIAAYLSNNLSSSGIESIRPTAKIALDNLQAFKYSLNSMILAMQEIEAQLYNQDAKVEAIAAKTE